MADSGIPVPVLQEILDHHFLETTRKNLHAFHPPPQLSSEERGTALSEPSNAGANRVRRCEPSDVGANRVTWV